MCGIVGMVASSTTGFNWNQQRIFNQLLWVNTLRGEDSTGVFGVNQEGNVDYLKTAGDAHEMITSKEYKDFKDNIFSDYRMVVGHNRKATRGAVSDDNAHPFVEDTIALVHNGTLVNHGKLTKELVEVDSHAILHSIVERGYEETLKDIEGAFTLAWYDTKDKTLRVIRNDQRPLYIASTFGAWYFASEKEMLELVLGREDSKIADMTECVPGTMYYWEMDDVNNLWYKPVELWSPPKSTTSVVSYVKKETTEDAGTTTTAYNNLDFPIGTKITICPVKIDTFKKVNQLGFSEMLHGLWYFDETVPVRVWCKPSEADLLEIDDEDEEHPMIIQAKITCVISKGSKITLVCEKPTHFVPDLDSNSKEIYEDEFIFTTQQCDDCKTNMTFEDAKKGVFVYRKEADYDLLCHKCK